MEKPQKDREVFTHPTPLKHNGYPKVTSEFAAALLGHFAGGHTPAIRNALLELERAARDEEGLPQR